MPVAVFPPILGLCGLAAGWRGAVLSLGVPPALPEMLAGAVAAVAVLALVALTTKIARRPGVVIDEVQTLPGRAGLSAAVLVLYLLAMLAAPLSGGLGRGLLILGLAAHLGLLAVLIPALITGPQERRRVTPVWHLAFAGGLVAALAAQALGWPGLAAVLFWPSATVAVMIWGLSAAQFARESVPAPLRPLLVIHLAPVALIGMVGLGLGVGWLAMAAAGAALAVLTLMAARAGWLLTAGFSPFWGALTFPLAATAALWVQMAASHPLRIPAVLLLVLATLVVLPVAFAILRLWAVGELAVRTNAAAA